VEIKKTNERQLQTKGYNSVSPYFIVDGARKMVDFLKESFNANRKSDMIYREWDNHAC